MPLVVGMALCGCVDLSHVPPQAANSATLWIQNSSDNAVWPVGYKVASDCRGNFVLDPQAMTIASGRTAKFVLPPDEPFSLTISYHGYSGGPVYVNVPMTFTPKANGVYRLVFSVTDRHYRVTMVRTIGADEVPDSTFEIQKFLSPLLPGGAWCANRE